MVFDRRFHDIEGKGGVVPLNPNPAVPVGDVLAGPDLSAMNIPGTEISGMPTPTPGVGDFLKSGAGSIFGNAGNAALMSQMLLKILGDPHKTADLVGATQQSHAATKTAEKLPNTGGGGLTPALEPGKTSVSETAGTVPGTRIRTTKELVDDRQDSINDYGEALRRP